MENKGSYTPAEVMEIMHLYREESVLNASLMYCPMEECVRINRRCLEILLQVPENVRDEDIKSAIRMRQHYVEKEKQ